MNAQQTLNGNKVTPSDDFQQPIAKSIWLLFASIYATQYIGVSFIMASTVIIMREMGMPLDQIAKVSVIALPLFLKIFFAPLIDYLRPPLPLKLQGQYRSWLIFAQIVMTLLLLALSLFDIVSQFSTVLLLMLMYTLTVSVQDVAIDGLACKFFNEEERKFANSIQFSSNLLGNVLGGGILLITYQWFGWQGSFIVLAVLTALACLQVIFFTETSFQERRNQALDHMNGNATSDANNISTGDELSDSSVGVIKRVSFTEFLGTMKAFIGKHKSWFGLLVVYPVGFSGCFGLLKLILVDAGWTKAQIGAAFNIYGSIFGIISALFAGLIMRHIGKYKALITLTIAQTLVLFALLPQVFGYTDTLMVYAAITVYFLINPALLATVATHIMHRTSTEEAKSSLFTLQLGLFAFMGFVYHGLATVLAKAIGFQAAMITCIVLGFLVVFHLVRLVQAKKI